jgi:competence protein ComEA
MVAKGPMSEDDPTPSVDAAVDAELDAENARGQPAVVSQPNLPIQRRSVQWTVVFLAILCGAVVVWSGRKTLWPEPEREFVRPAVLLQIDINRAGDREFALLPDVGPVLARRIVDDRRRNGKFASLDDLARVHGIGPKTIKQIAVYCRKVAAPDTLAVLADD